MQPTMQANPVDERLRVDCNSNRGRAHGNGGAGDPALHRPQASQPRVRPGAVVRIAPAAGPWAPSSTNERSRKPRAVRSTRPGASIPPRFARPEALKQSTIGNPPVQGSRRPGWCPLRQDVAAPLGRVGRADWACGTTASRTRRYSPRTVTVCRGATSRVGEGSRSVTTGDTAYPPS